MTAIITEYGPPPVPSRIWDWLAYIDAEGPYGRGPSELTAVKDLAVQLHAYYAAARCAG